MIVEKTTFRVDFVTRHSYLASRHSLEPRPLQVFILFLYLPNQPTHHHKRQGDGERSILLGWPKEQEEMAILQGSKTLNILPLYPLLIDLILLITYQQGCFLFTKFIISHPKISQVHDILTTKQSFLQFEKNFYLLKGILQKAINSQQGFFCAIFPSFYFNNLVYSFMLII